MKPKRPYITRDKRALYVPGLVKGTTYIPGVVKVTQREREILQHIADGLQYKEIAKRMPITVRTLKYYVDRLRASAGIIGKNYCALIAWAFRNKLVS